MTAPSTPTTVAVQRASGRARCRFVPGAFGPRVQGGDANGARVALVAAGALLLGGDDVVIDLEVGAGAWLEIVETAGTVAYDAAGRASSWTVRARLGAGATLVWDGLPFVVADGADVTRRTELMLERGARVVLRETLVLGRSGERGGAARSYTVAMLEERPLLVEDLDLSPRVRALPGVVGSHRVMDSVLALGWRPEATPGVRDGAYRFELDGPGTLVRWLGGELHRSGAVDEHVAAWRHLW
ncbi:urease accessory protein UreD [Rhodococcus zopfii]|uniref:Urease accessory protein UreD n=2 Tax=Rhodococcus zopfii TaxID=43772 RepID=A0ABU3WN69_9NOCA|nr:urease accessory protein UreD [Rhodococcus zopfii]MDV2475452.1 urease accessory protein UreD [Rhodococcus zopfii]